MVGTKEWYQKNRERVLAELKRKRDENPAYHARYQREMYQKHREKRLASKKRYLDEMREMLFKHYGDKCSCCRESEKIFLTLEHVNNDGAAHRRQVKSMNPVALILDLRKRGWPEHGYTILCFNCNLGKAKNKNVCPHIQNKVSDILQEAR